MPWRRVVIRPDSIIRFWSLNLADCVESLSSFIDSPDLKSIKFNRLVAMNDGSEHIRLEEFGTLAQALSKTAASRPRLFQEIGQHYEHLGQEWLASLAAFGVNGNLHEKTNDELASHIEQFVENYRAYAPILWVPFIVERRYAEDYPKVLDKIARAALDSLAGEVPEHGSLGLLIRGGVLELPTEPRQVRDALRTVIEHSPRRTMAEEKEQRLLEIAAALERDVAAAPLFAKEHPPAPEKVGATAPVLFAELDAALAKHRWLAHWGYPPLYHDSTIEDFVEDVHLKIRAGAQERLERDERERAQAERDYSELLKLADLKPSEQQLIEDINYFNFLRTYRMEIKIRAQYLSIPLFREAERRAIEAKKLQRDDIFLMVPTETLTFLRSGGVPQDISDRRNGWALPTEVEGQRWSVLAGAAYDDFVDGFFSVIDQLDNARGSNNPTAPFVGGKAAGLFRLTEAGRAVPRYFVITTHAYSRFIQSNELELRLEQCLGIATESDLESLDHAASAASELIHEADIPRQVQSAIQDAYKALGAEFVAVRSSASVEDSEQLSWAGRFRSVLDVPEEKLMSAVKDVWSSLFSPSAIVYAREAGIDLARTPMAVIVQEMVSADVAGVMNTTHDPSTPSVVEVEAAFGYASPVVDGEITPDRYLIDTATPEPTIIDRNVVQQARAATRSGWKTLDPRRGKQPKLTDSQLFELADAGKQLEREFGGAQDVEFAIADNKLWTVQSRPQTGLSAAPVSPAGAIPAGARLVATGLKGKMATISRGRSYVLKDLSEGRRFEPGNVLVVHAATPAWDPIVFKASALITNDGGATSHAIRVANERGIPVVVGTNVATEVIPDGAEVILDTIDEAFKGKVYIVR